MLEKRGLLKGADSKDTNELQSVTCKNCRCENSSTARFCTQCGIAFFIKDAMDVELKKKDAAQLMEDIFNDEELKLAIVRKVMQGNMQ